MGWLFVAILAGLVLLGVIIELLERAVDRQVIDGHDRASHRRLMDEIARHDPHPQGYGYWKSHRRPSWEAQTWEEEQQP